MHLRRAALTILQVDMYAFKQAGPIGLEAGFSMLIPVHCQPSHVSSDFHHCLMQVPMQVLKSLLQASFDNASRTLTSA